MDRRAGLRRLAPLVCGVLLTACPGPDEAREPVVAEPVDVVAELPDLSSLGLTLVEPEWPKALDDVVAASDIDPSTGGDHPQLLGAMEDGGYRGGASALWRGGDGLGAWVAIYELADEDGAQVVFAELDDGLGQRDPVDPGIDDAGGFRIEGGVALYAVRGTRVVRVLASPDLELGRAVLALLVVP